MHTHTHAHTYTYAYIHTHMQVKGKQNRTGFQWGILCSKHGGTLTLSVPWLSSCYCQPAHIPFYLLTQRKVEKQRHFLYPLPNSCSLHSNLTFVPSTPPNLPLMRSPVNDLNAILSDNYLQLLIFLHLSAVFANGEHCFSPESTFSKSCLLLSFLS